MVQVAIDLPSEELEYDDGKEEEEEEDETSEKKPANQLFELPEQIENKIAAIMREEEEELDWLDKQKQLDLEEDQKQSTKPKTTDFDLLNEIELDKEIVEENEKDNIKEPKKVG